MSEKIYMNLGNGEKCAADIVEMLTDTTALVEFEQDGVGLVRATAQNVEGEWMWDGSFEPVEEEAGGVFTGFVVTPEGEYFVQRPADNQWGFELLSEDQSWPGGIGAARTWTAVARESVPAEAERALGWILDEFQPVNED